MYQHLTIIIDQCTLFKSATDIQFPVAVVAAVAAAVLALRLFAAFQLESPCHFVAEPAETSVMAAAFAAAAAVAAVGTAAQDLHSFQTAPLLPSPQAADQASSCLLAGS